MSDEPKLGEKRRGNAGKGRPKGSVNKATASVKEALEIAFEGIGGAERLTTWAATNETEFFKLWAKMLPQDVKADVALSITKITREIVRPRDPNG